MFVLSPKHFIEGCFSVESSTLERKGPKVLACEARGGVLGLMFAGYVPLAP